MSDPLHRDSRAARPRCWSPVLLLTLLLAQQAAAQTAPSWMPPADSMRIWRRWVSDGFQRAQGDSAGGNNYLPFQIVGRAARRMLVRMNADVDLLEAPAIAPVLDSIGCEAEVAVDPAQPAFALVMVRNPWRRAAHAVGFLFWSKAEDFHYQGAEFRGGMNPTTRVWYTGQYDRSYEWAVLDHERGPGPAHFSLFQLQPGGLVWTAAQDDEQNPILGSAGEAVFADLNGDGIPEVVHWPVAHTDSLFVPCSDCPKLTYEDIYVERHSGFVLEDSRLLATGYAAFVAFVRHLLDHDRAGAARFVARPADVTRAISEGWSLARKPGTWRIEYIEEGERWPRFMEARFAGPQGVKRYIIRFGKQEGRWVILDFGVPQPAKRAPARAPGEVPR